VVLRRNESFNDMRWQPFIFPREVHVAGRLIIGWRAMNAPRSGTELAALVMVVFMFFRSVRYQCLFVVTFAAALVFRAASPAVKDVSLMQLSHSFL